MIYFESEKHFEDLLFENQSFLSKELGVHPASKISRQVSLNQYGICDLLAIYVNKHDDGQKTYYIELIELKNTPIDHKHIIQCARYKTFFDKLIVDNGKIEFVCHLIGMRTFTEKKNVDDLVFLCQSIDWLKVYETTLDPFDGLCFELVKGWYSVNSKGEKETRLEGVNDGEV